MTSAAPRCSEVGSVYALWSCTINYLCGQETTSGLQPAQQAQSERRSAQRTGSTTNLSAAAYYEVSMQVLNSGFG